MAINHLMPYTNMAGANEDWIIKTEAELRRLLCSIMGTLDSEIRDQVAAAIAAQDWVSLAEDAAAQLALNGELYGDLIVNGLLKGYSPQSMALVGEDLAIICCSSLSDDDATRYLFVRLSTGAVLGTTDGQQGHAGSCWYSDGILYVKTASSAAPYETTVWRLGVNTSGFSLDTESYQPITLVCNERPYWVAGQPGHGYIVAYSQITDRWILYDFSPALTLPAQSVTLTDGKPIELPAVLTYARQTVSIMNGRLYWVWLPYSVGVWAIGASSCTFERWLNLQQAPSDLINMGELEQFVVSNDGVTAYSLAQYFLPADDHTTRTYTIARHSFRRSVPQADSKGVIGVTRSIWVSPDSTAGCPDGSEAKPYPSLAMAVRAAISMPCRVVNINVFGDLTEESVEINEIGPNIYIRAARPTGYTGPASIKLDHVEVVGNVWISGATIQYVQVNRRGICRLQSCTIGVVTPGYEPDQPISAPYNTYGMPLLYVAGGICSLTDCTCTKDPTTYPAVVAYRGAIVTGEFTGGYPLIDAAADSLVHLASVTYPELLGEGEVVSMAGGRVYLPIKTGATYRLSFGAGNAGANTVEDVFVASRANTRRVVVYNTESGDYSYTTYWTVQLYGSEVAESAGVHVLDCHSIRTQISTGAVSYVNRATNTAFGIYSIKQIG